MELDDVLARIPYLNVHDLSVETEGDRVLVRMPLHHALSNHVGILHAGALFTAAETAAGVAAYRVVPGDRAFVLLRSASVSYTRRAESGVLSTGSVEPAAADAARAAFDAEGRADVLARVRCVDAEGETVFEGTFDYAVRPRSVP